MKVYLVVTLCLAGVWLMTMLAYLSVGEYPRKQLHDRIDDWAKAVLLVAFLLVGSAVLYLRE